MDLSTVKNEQKRSSAQNIKRYQYQEGAATQVRSQSKEGGYSETTYTSIHQWERRNEASEAPLHTRTEQQHIPLNPYKVVSAPKLCSQSITWGRLN